MATSHSGNMVRLRFPKLARNAHSSSAWRRSAGSAAVHWCILGRCGPIPTRAAPRRATCMSSSTPSERRSRTGGGSPSSGRRSSPPCATGRSCGPYWRWSDGSFRSWPGPRRPGAACGPERSGWRWGRVGCAELGAARHRSGRRRSGPAASPPLRVAWPSWWWDPTTRRGWKRSRPGSRSRGSPSPAALATRSFQAHRGFDPRSGGRGQRHQRPLGPRLGEPPRGRDRRLRRGRSPPGRAPPPAAALGHGARWAGAVGGCRAAPGRRGDAVRWGARGGDRAAAR